MDAQQYTVTYTIQVTAKSPLDAALQYTVTYTIQVTAKSPLDAALQVEGILNNMDYRPYLEVTDANGSSTGIDLEELETEE